MQLIAYVGLIAFAVAWVPASVDTIKAGRCDANLGFLALMFIGSASLMLYALLKGDDVFFAVNLLTTAGALVNLYFKFFPGASKTGRI